MSKLNESIDQEFSARAKEIVTHLPTEAQTLLAQLITEKTPAVIDQAMLVLFIALRYSTACSPDKLTEHIYTAKFFSESTTKSRILNELICPVRTGFVACQLKVDEYWNVISPFNDYLIYEIIQRRARRDEDAAISALFKQKWNIPDASMHFEEAEHRLLVDSLIEHVITWASGVAGNLGKSEQLTKELDETADSLIERLRPYKTLVDWVHALTSFEFIRSVVDANANNGSELQKQLHEKWQILKKSHAGLFSWEMDLIGLETEELGRLKECRRLLPITQRESGPSSEVVSIGVTAERIDGKDYVPMWIQQYIFSEGGRFSQNSLGPMAYFLLVLEQSESETSCETLGLAEPVVTDTDVYMPLLIVDSDDPLHVEYRFPITYAESLRTLILVAVTGRFRLDILRTGSDGRLSIAKSMFVDLPEDIHKQIRTAAIKALDEHFDGDPQKLRAARMAEKSEAIYALLSFENGKSEQLRILSGAIPEDVPESPARDAWHEFQVVRSDLLSLEQQRVSHLMENDDRQADADAESIAILRQKHAGILQVLRGRDRERFKSLMGKVDENDLGSALESEDRGIVHLGFARNELIACVGFNRDELLKAEFIDFPDFMLDDAIDCINELVNAKDDDDEIDAFEEMLSLYGEWVAKPIATSLAQLGITKVIFSPSWFFELVPLHCLPINSANSAFFMDAFDAVSYAPSLTMLHRSRYKRKAGSVKAFACSPSESPLPHARAEAEIIARFFPTSATFADDTATADNFLHAIQGASVLHAACHGDWYPSDPLRSALVLSPVASKHGHLSAASILAVGRLADVSLVTLSCCDSGRHMQEINTFQEYRGLDGICIAQGARSVVSTLWSVGDLAALLVMSRFYYELSKCKPIDEALIVAVNQLRHGFEANLPSDRTLVAALDGVAPTWRDDLSACSDEIKHPIVWGAFRCSGLTWHPLEFT